MREQVDIDRLLREAWIARERSYAPYSSFTVGAALLGVSGVVYYGCNVENISYGLTICAERAAVCAAIQGVERHFMALAVVADTIVPIVPCGACRQFLAEFDSKLIVVSEGRDRVRAQWNLQHLLPSPKDGILDAAG